MKKIVALLFVLTLVLVACGFDIDTESASIRNVAETLREEVAETGSNEDFTTAEYQSEKVIPYDLGGIEYEDYHETYQDVYIEEIVTSQESVYTSTPEVTPAPTTSPERFDNNWLDAPGNQPTWTANRNSEVIHSFPECSNMSSPVRTTIDTALTRPRGGRPCQNCWTNR